MATLAKIKFLNNFGLLNKHLAFLPSQCLPVATSSLLPKQTNDRTATRFEIK